MRVLFVTLILALLLAQARAEAARSETLDRDQISVGVRDDARPFIWRDPATNDYLGFYWDICASAVERAGYHLRKTDVDSSRRAGFLNTGEGDFDLLCDPTTITLKRMQNFAYNGRAPHLEFSPIIFVANGSYLQLQRGTNAAKAAGILPKDAPVNPSCDAIIKWLEGLGNKPPEEWTWYAATDTASAPSVTDGGGLLGWLSDTFDVTLRQSPEGVGEKTRAFEIWGYVKGSTIGETLNDQAPRRSKPNWVICPWERPSHQKAAEDFCDGRLARYFGDVDIIKAAVAEYGEKTAKTCPADESATTVGSYEPYAFVMSAHHFPDFPERLTLALYEMFEDGTIERLFAGHFPRTKKSQHLSTLLRINRIPAGAAARND
ncbi:substrate-binding periplasmic protein [Neorhizobium alkalisoli]|uniref:substrate-binding periplasmic protein n=1 Tax=Neorhizobium alkalisoli TaxID=528178 RepID=UPI000CF8EA02|nr:transporter substrate-binding domain-containing protein [Neorhizobium alkalisoli]